MTLVLASSSAIRATMLAKAGVAVEVAPGTLDENALKAAHSGNADLAKVLAGAKAAAGSEARPDDWVIGADSTVSVDGVQFDKPRDRAEAEAHLARFSGRELLLSSAAALARGGIVQWSAIDRAILRVRNLTGDFIAGYLDAEWPAVGHCVGVFRMEERGVQLFESIDGNHFTILGMPLLPLLGALRERGLVAS